MMMSERERERESATLNSENRRAIKSTLKKEKRATAKNERETLDFGASSSFVFSLRLREGRRMLPILKRGRQTAHMDRARKLKTGLIVAY